MDRPKQPRGFTLIETMVVIAMLGVFSTLAVVSLIPAVRKAELGAASDNVLGFVTRARFQALANRRCVQVLFEDKTPAVKQQMLLRELNAFDCDGIAGGFQNQPMTTAPRIRPADPLWITIDRVSLDDDDIKVHFINHPSSLTNAEGGDYPGVVSVHDELRLRPTGRVWSPDADLTNDDVTIELIHEQTGATQTMKLAGTGVWAELPGGH